MPPPNAPLAIIDPITGQPLGGIVKPADLDAHFLREGFRLVDVGPGWVYANSSRQFVRMSNGQIYLQTKFSGHGGALGDIMDERTVIALVAAIFTAGLSTAAIGGAGEGAVQLSGPGAEGAAGSAGASSTATTLGGSATAAGAAAALTADAASTANATVEQLSGPISDNIDAAGSTASSTFSDALSSVSDTVKSVKSELSDIFGPIGDVLHSITGTINDINANIIQPIVGPIKALIDAQKTLSAAIASDLHNGVRGLLNIPTDIANAFNSVDATVQRSLAMWAQTSGDQTQRIFGGLLTGAHGATIGTSLENLHAALAPTDKDFISPSHFDLSEQIDLAEYKARIGADQEEIAKGEGIAAGLVQWAVRSFASLEALALQREPYNELWKEEVQKAFGIKRFDPATALALYQRGELDEAETREELRIQGFSDSRASALIAQARLLPDSNKALSLFARRWVDDVSAAAMLRAQGWSDADAQTLLHSAYTELGPDALLELVRRGLISESEMEVAVQRQGFRQADSALFAQTRWRLLGLADVMALADRVGSSGAQSAFPSLGADAPPELAAYASKLGIDADAARVLWSNHWRILNPELAVMAFFRGYINAPQLDVALAQGAIPPELRQNFIDLQRPLVPFRTISALINQGIITEPDAMDILRSRGFSDRDANWLVHAGRKVAAPSQAQVSNDLHGLTRQTVLALYDAGTVERSEAQSTLLQLGLSEHAASAELDLHDVRAAHVARQADIDEVIALARTGELSLEDADAQLAALNLTAAELSKAQARMRKLVRSGLKMPSDAQILGMWKKGIIDDDEALDALQLAGFSSLWARRLIELEGARGQKPQGP